VRELAREGLIVENPRRGNVVSTLTAHDLAEVYDVREAFEIVAARHVIQRPDDAVLNELERHLDALDRGHEYLKNIVHDLAFHRALVSGSRNDRMTLINEQMLMQTAHLLRTAVAANPTLQSSARPSAHRDILAALIARNPEAARAAIEAHYQYAGERVFPALEWFEAGFGAW
jgi:DNA-binding GntR family transcriptional regulator